MASNEESHEGKEEDELDSFAVLGISAHAMAQMAVILSLCQLPIAFNSTEFAHCLAVLVIVQFEMISTKLLSKVVAKCQPPDSPFSAIADAEWRFFLLWPNLVNWCKSNDFFSFVYYVWSILWYESYVNMLLAGPLLSCGWPLAAATALVGITTGFCNHGMVNGLMNGVMGTVFYITMAVMFSVSNSVMSVTVAHSVFYFRTLHAGATSPGFSHPLFVGILITNTVGMFALLQALTCVLPPAMPLETPAEVVEYQSLSPGIAFAAISFLLDGVRMYVLTTRLLRRIATSSQNGTASTESGYKVLDGGSRA